MSRNYPWPRKYSGKSWGPPPNELSAKNRARRDANPGIFLFYGAQARAKVLGLQFDLHKEDIKIPEICPILQVPIGPPRTKYAPSLDRIDNTKDYVRGNVRVISKAANVLKGGVTIPLAHRLIAYMEGRI